MVEGDGCGGGELVHHGVECHVLEVGGGSQGGVSREGGVVQIREVGVVIV